MYPGVCFREQPDLAPRVLAAAHDHDIDIFSTKEGRKQIHGPFTFAIAVTEVAVDGRPTSGDVLLDPLV